MSPLLVIVIPLALTIIGIMLNSFHIVHDQPAFSFEEDLAHKLAAERQRVVSRNASDRRVFAVSKWRTRDDHHRP